MVYPIIKPLILSAIFAYIAYPLYRKIRKIIKSDSWSAFIVSILILVLISLPIIFITNALISQTQVAYTLSRRIIITGNPFYAECTGNQSLLCSMIDPIQEFLKEPKVKFYLEDALKNITTTIINKITTFIFAIPMRILDLFVMLFSIYYLFKDGPALAVRLRKMLPITIKTRNLLFCRMKDVFYAMIYGYFFVAMIQGILGGLGFFAVGLSSPVLWGIIMGVAALLPIFGTGLVWFPASLYLVINGVLENEHTGIWKGIILFAYGFIIVSTIDNFIRPKLVSAKANIHPIVVLAGIIGGISIFGFIGIIIGPIILVALITIFGIYENVMKENHDDFKDKAIACPPNPKLYKKDRKKAARGNKK